MARFLANHMKPFEPSDKVGGTQINFERRLKAWNCSV